MDKKISANEFLFLCLESEALNQGLKKAADYTYFSVWNQEVRSQFDLDDFWFLKKILNMCFSKRDLGFSLTKNRFLLKNHQLILLSGTERCVWTAFAFFKPNSHKKFGSPECPKNPPLLEREATFSFADYMAFRKNSD